MLAYKGAFLFRHLASNDNEKMWSIFEMALRYSKNTKVLFCSGIWRATTTKKCGTFLRWLCVIARIQRCFFVQAFGEQRQRKNVEHF